MKVYKQVLLELKWRLFGYPELPPKGFKEYYLIVDDKKYYPQFTTMGALYNNYVSIESIMKIFGTSRERTRQDIWRAYRGSFNM